MSTSIYEYLIDGTSKEKEIYLAWHTRNRSEMMKTRREFFCKNFLMEIFPPWNNYTVKLLQTITDKSFKSRLQWSFSHHQGYGLADGSKAIKPWPILLASVLSYASNYPSCCSCHLSLNAHTQLLLLPRSLNSAHRHCHWCVEQQHTFHLLNKSMHMC